MQHNGTQGRYLSLFLIGKDWAAWSCCKCIQFLQVGVRLDVAVCLYCGPVRYRAFTRITREH